MPTPDTTKVLPLKAWIIIRVNVWAVRNRRLNLCVDGYHFHLLVKTRWAKLKKAMQYRQTIWT